MKLLQRLFGAPTPPPLRLLQVDSANARAMAVLLAKGGFARSWSASECEALLADRIVVADGAFTPLNTLAGAVLSRCAGDEAEVLSIVVEPEWRKTGIGRRLMLAHCDMLARKGIRQLFLEVDENNAAARALYARLGFVTKGSRAGYYPLPDGTRATALILQRNLAA